MGGYVTDPSGAVVPNARVTITASNGGSRTATTDGQGRWAVAGLESGNFKAKTEMLGFRTSTFNLDYDASKPSSYNFPLSVASLAETVEVSGTMPQTTKSGTNAFHGPAYGASVGGPIYNQNSLMMLTPGVAKQNAASENVMNLQRKVAGVLPVPVDVPRAGTSFSFVRPLVLDEETKVTFSYKSR